MDDAETRLEALDAELRELTVAITHDLRASVRHLVAFSRVLLDDHAEGLDPRQVELLGILREAALTLDRRLNVVARYGRVARVEAEPRVVPLGDLLDAALAGLPAPLAAGRVRRAGPLPPVLVDVDLAVEAISPILDNALRYSDGPVTVTVAPDADGAVRVLITDEGPGIAPKQRERVFRLFDRADAPQGVPGDGAGLALARRAAGRLGGSVAVEDPPPGGGCRVCLRLPAYVERTSGGVL